MKAVWATPETQDYYRHVLRSGAVDTSYTSILNHSNDGYLANLPRYADRMRHHKHKYDRVAELVPETGQIIVNTGERDEVIAFQKQRQSADEVLFFDMVKHSPHLADTEDVKQKLREIEGSVPRDLPMRQEIIDSLLRDYMLMKYRNLLSQGLVDRNPMRPNLSNPRERVEFMTGIERASAEAGQRELGVAMSAQQEEEEGAESIGDIMSRRALSTIASVAPSVSLAGQEVVNPERIAKQHIKRIILLVRKSRSPRHGEMSTRIPHGNASLGSHIHVMEDFLDRNASSADMQEIVSMHRDVLRATPEGELKEIYRTIEMFLRNIWDSKIRLDV